MIPLILRRDRRFASAARSVPLRLPISLLIGVAPMGCSSPKVDSAAHGVADGGRPNDSGAPDSGAADSGDGTADGGDSGDTGPLPVYPTEHPVVINELMLNNDHGYTDSDGLHPDWIELYNPGEADVALDGWTLSDDPEAVDDRRIGAPLDGLVVPARGHLLLAADGGTGPGHLPFALSAGGELLTLRAPGGDRWTLQVGPMPEDVALRRITDGCADAGEGEGCLGFAPHGTPGAPNALPPAPTTAFIDTGAPWRFGACPGVEGWETAAEDPAGWAEGPAPIGAGEDGLRTYIDLGPADTRTPSWCFRAEVEGVEGLRRLELWLRRDDGARVVLDGVELMRDLLPEGPLDPSSYAIGTVNGGEERAYRIYPIDPALLGPGLHRLAVEVHQGSPTSGDLTFDLRLLGE
jgi:hypothetical protein